MGTTTDKATLALTAFLDSWERHQQIMSSVCSVIGEGEKDLKASAKNSTIMEYLCHIHGSRSWWLSNVAPEYAAKLDELYVKKEGEWVLSADLETVKKQLVLSGKAVGEATRELIDAGVQQIGAYEHPVYFLQHMLWHESGHLAVILVSLRLVDKEPDETWEEANIWGRWRTEEL